jgi:hypothetical protein
MSSKFFIIAFSPPHPRSDVGGLRLGFTCLDFAQLYRPHDEQYIAPHKYGKHYFALHSKMPQTGGPSSRGRFKTGHFPLIWFNFLATLRA